MPRLGTEYLGLIPRKTDHLILESSTRSLLSRLLPADLRKEPSPFVFVSISNRPGGNPLLRGHRHSHRG